MFGSQRSDKITGSKHDFLPFLSTRMAHMAHMAYGFSEQKRAEGSSTLLWMPTGLNALWSGEPHEFLFAPHGEWTSKIAMAMSPLADGRNCWGVLASNLKQQ